MVSSPRQQDIFDVKLSYTQTCMYIENVYMLNDKFKQLKTSLVIVVAAVGTLYIVHFGILTFA